MMRFELTHETIERINARWAAEGIAIRPGNSPESLAAFEARYQVVLPPAVREYFAAVDGSGDDSDEELLRFWPLEEVIPIAEGSGRDRAELPELEHWFLFADFLICSHTYAVRLTPDPGNGGTVAAFNGLDMEVQAGSFALFLERYLFEPKRLALGFVPTDRRWLARDDEVIAT
jgi:hypothetical protein